MKKFWTDEILEQQLKACIKKYQLECMPTNLYLRNNGYGPLSGAIQKRGGFVFWANKLGLDYEAKTNAVWNEETIESGIRKAMGILGIDRMPTSPELHSIGMVTLANAVSRTKKYSGWADHLGLSSKKSETSTGVFYEKHMKDVLTSLDLGYHAEKTSMGFPYDLLVNGCVKIDIKAGKVRATNGFKAVSFGINKKQPTCDLYICVKIDESDDVETIFVIPSHFITSTTITLGTNSKYDRFINAWHYVEQYSNFMASVQ